MIPVRTAQCRAFGCLIMMMVMVGVVDDWAIENYDSVSPSRRASRIEVGNRQHVAADPLPSPDGGVRKFPLRGRGAVAVKDECGSDATERRRQNHHEPVHGRPSGG